MSPLVFLLGPSGVGKSLLGEWLAADLQFRFIEVDRWPKKDGIDAEDIRAEWEQFWGFWDAGPLATAVREKSAAVGAAGSVMSFASQLVLGPQHLDALMRVGISPVILWGTQAECLGGFMERERQTGRLLDEDHWRVNNERIFRIYGDESYDPWRLVAFESGRRLTRKSLVAKIQKRVAG